MNMLTGLLVAIAFGALTGVLWGGLDNVFFRLMGGFNMQDNQITSIIRMVIAGMVAQQLAGYVIVAIFHTLPGGGLLSLISIVLSILIYFNARNYLNRGY
jgi:hypothetical protein